MSGKETATLLHTNPKSFQQRTILLVGRAGAGKKTLANHIAGSKVFPVLPVAASQSETHEATCISQCGTYVYTFKLFDWELKGNIGEVFSNYYREKKTDGFNLLLFVIRKGQDRDCGDVRTILPSLEAKLSKHSALIVTGCEGLQSSQRKAFLDDFRRADSTFERFMTLGMFAVGFPDSSSGQDMIKEDEEVLRKLVKNSKYSIIAGVAFFDPPENFYECVLENCRCTIV